MNYQLKISLEGADQANASLDSLISKVEKISTGKNISFDKWLTGGVGGSEIEKTGENVGVAMVKGIKKGLNPLKPIMKEAFQAIAKGERENNKWWEDAIKVGKEGLINPMGSLAQFIKQQHTGGGKKVDREFWTSLYPPIKDAPPILQQQKSASPKELGMAIFTGISNPWIGGRMMNDIMAKSGGGGVGIFGKGGAGGFAEWYNVFIYSTKIFKFAVDKFNQTIEQARQVYSKALQSGMGTGFTVRRSMLADIIGVSETEVFKFGQQMNYLNPRLENAVSILTKTNKTLTQNSWEFKILEKNMSALYATVSSQLAPTITSIVRIINGLVIGLNKLVDSKFFKGAMTAIVESAIGKPMAYSMRLLNMLHDASMPAPIAQMNQLPVSHWEKMGLVTMGGTQNYAKDTAKNTKEIAAGIKMIVAGMKGKSGSTFGMSPLVSNP